MHGQAQHEARDVAAESNLQITQSPNENRPIEYLRAGPLALDGSQRTAWLHGNEIKLTRGEFDLLWILTRYAGRIVSRRLIIPHLRGIPYDGLDRSVDIVVARLRKKLGDHEREGQLIKSIHGVGYMLACESMDAEI